MTRQTPDIPPPARSTVRRYVGDRLSRPELRGRLCRVINTWRGRGPHNIQVEFPDGTRVACPVRCIRRLDKQRRTP